MAALANVGWERVGVQVIDRRRYSDWHRVERVLTRFDREMNELRSQGRVDA